MGRNSGWMTILGCGRPAVVVTLALFLLASGALTGCRSTRFRESRDSKVFQGEVLHGRVPAYRPRQDFTFEGVGPSLLDITVQADEANQAAPKVQIFDPRGQPLPVRKHVVSAAGAATMKVRDLPLVESGTYRAVVEPARATSKRGYYTFRHRMHFPGPVPKVMRLSAQQPQPVTFTAPRYGRVIASIKPRTPMRPDFLAVYDPDGGPALDPGSIPPGSPRPAVQHLEDGTMVLAFTASKSGLYKLMAGAKRGCQGMGEVRVRVETLPNECRRVLHHGAPLADFAPGSGPAVPQGPSFPAPADATPMLPPRPAPPALHPYERPPAAPGGLPPLGIDPNAQAYLNVPNR